MHKKNNKRQNTRKGCRVKIMSEIMTEYAKLPDLFNTKNRKQKMQGKTCQKQLGQILFLFE